MADNKKENGYAALVKQVKDVALGTHPLSKFVPPALLLMDALLCSLIISRVSCESFPYPIARNWFILTQEECRHGNRLESIHGTSRALY